MRASIPPGSLLAHYRVLAPLGSGGMGEVYRAEDLRLERSVALKILPSELVRNEDRLRRFVQEAKAASSLSHPHIVTIHEIGEARPSQAPIGPPPPGQGSDGTPGAAAPAAAPIVHYIAMELVDGDTLRERIHRDNTDLRTLLGYLAQAAEGLAKAHAAGIVHRDLKPDNIMISRDGYAKILDFGLAKLTERKPSTELASDPTAMREETREGSVLGTVGYMSPEQVQGKPVDHRSDIFSFGCILYEAATRRKPFNAESDVECMHQILREAPEPVESLNPQAPAELRRMIRRCLAKEPDRRYQSMKDLAIELGELVEEFESLSATSMARTSGPSLAIPGPAASRSLPRLALWTAGGLIVAAGLIAAGWRLAHRPHAAPPVAARSITMVQLTGSGKVTAGAISPDGKYVASAVEDGGRYSLWLRQVATSSDVQIVPPIAATYRGVAFSPDGSYVYFARLENEGSVYSVLFQLPVLGGTPRKLLFDVDTAVAFSPDGSRIAFVRGIPQKASSALVVANADGSNERTIVELKQPDQFVLTAPSWTTPGKIVASVRMLRDGVHLGVIEYDAATGAGQAFGSQDWISLSSLAALPDGGGVALSGTPIGAGVVESLFLMSRANGTPARILTDLNSYTNLGVTADSRSLAAIQILNSSNLSLAPLDGAQAPTPILSRRDELASAACMAPPGTIVYESVRGDRVDLWSCDLQGGNARQLTTGPGFHVDPCVSHDGQFVVYTSLREDRVPHVWRIDLDGDNERQLTSGAGEGSGHLSPDGRWLFYVSATHDGRLWKMPMDGGAPVQMGDSLAVDLDVSPVGQQLAYVHWVQRGGRGVLVLTVAGLDPGAGARELPYPADVRLMRWMPDGSGLAFVLQRGGVPNVWTQPLAGGEMRQLTRFASGEIRGFDWTPDGKRLVLATGDASRDMVMLRDFR